MLRYPPFSHLVANQLRRREAARSWSGAAGVAAERCANLAAGTDAARPGADVHASRGRDRRRTAAQGRAARANGARGARGGRAPGAAAAPARGRARRRRRSAVGCRSHTIGTVSTGAPARTARPINSGGATGPRPTADEPEELEAEAAGAPRGGARAGDQVRRPGAEERGVAGPSFDDELGADVERMVALMRDAMGVGLAATQLGVLRRLLVFQAGRGRDADARWSTRDRVDAPRRPSSPRRGASACRGSSSTSSARCTPGSAAATTRASRS